MNKIKIVERSTKFAVLRQIRESDGYESSTDWGGPFGDTNVGIFHSINGSLVGYQGTDKSLILYLFEAPKTGRRIICKNGMEDL